MVASILEENRQADHETFGLDPAPERLAWAAERGDTAAFLVIYPLIDWTHRLPEEFIFATRMALTAGAYLLAREIAAQGAKQHPGHAEMQKYAYVLAPPRVIRSDLPPDPAIQANHEGLSANRLSYRGQWVALRNG